MCASAQYLSFCAPLFHINSLSAELLLRQVCAAALNRRLSPVATDSGQNPTMTIPRIWYGFKRDHLSWLTAGGLTEVLLLSNVAARVSLWREVPSPRSGASGNFVAFQPVLIVTRGEDFDSFQWFESFESVQRYWIDAGYIESTNHLLYEALDSNRTIKKKKNVVFCFILSTTGPDFNHTI